MTEAPGDPPAPRNETRRWMLGLLAVQVVFALFLFGSDLVRALPALLSPSAAPALETPVAPGDQTRRYRPDRVAPRPAEPGTRPLPAQDAMPSRLLFETAEWEGRPTLTLTGGIAPGDALRLQEELDRLEVPPELVFLDSPGGSVIDALEIGRMLRGIGAGTRMAGSGICLSACPYILAGGVTREVAEGAWVGVHQHYFGENTVLPAFLAVEDVQHGQGLVMGYLIEMGIDPGLMEKALLTPPDEIYLLLPEELLRYGLVTSGEAAIFRPRAREQDGR